MTELVESLRSLGVFIGSGHNPHTSHDATLYAAADHIETLEAALRTIQSAVPKYLKKEMTAEEFIDAVLAAADDQKVVRAVRASGASPER